MATYVVRLEIYLTIAITKIVDDSQARIDSEPRLWKNKMRIHEIYLGVVMTALLVSSTSNRS